MITTIGLILSLGLIMAVGVLFYHKGSRKKKKELPEFPAMAL